MTRNRFATRAVHSGHEPDLSTGAHVTPIFQTSTFAYGSFARGQRLFSGEEAGFIYSRIGNPTTRALEEKLADLELAEDAIAFASGMAAISALCFTILRPGDEVLLLGPLYGGSEGLFFETLAHFGICAREVRDEELESAISKHTKLIYAETPTNPTLHIHDLGHIARLSQAHGILSVADNTFSTPYLTRPIEHGIDLVIHSATKYLGGHGDAIGGILAGKADLLAAVRAEGLRHIGGTLGPLESYLFLRGMKTLALRMECHCANALRIARTLKYHPAIKTLHYPGLPEHPGHELAKRQMRQFGGMITLELHGGKAAAEMFLDQLMLFTQAVSLGDVESLACHPASTTHQLLSSEKRESLGISDALVRLSIGIEDPQDLIDDLSQALQYTALKLTEKTLEGSV